MICSFFSLIDQQQHVQMERPSFVQVLQAQYWSAGAAFFFFFLGGPLHEKIC